jgi:hypothetical protein
MLSPEKSEIQHATVDGQDGVQRTDTMNGDHVSPEAIGQSNLINKFGLILTTMTGGTSADLPPGYYRSFGFIGTVTVSRIAHCATHR